MSTSCTRELLAIFSWAKFVGNEFQNLISWEIDIYMNNPAYFALKLIESYLNSTGLHLHLTSEKIWILYLPQQSFVYAQSSELNHSIKQHLYLINLNNNIPKSRQKKFFPHYLFKTRETQKIYRKVGRICSQKNKRECIKM